MTDPAPPALPLPRRVLNAVIALACGAIVGMALSMIIVFGPEDIPAILAGRTGHLVMPLWTQLKIGLIVSGTYAGACCVIAPAFWRILRRVGRDGWISAAVLGFVLPFLFWSVTNFQSDHFETGRLVQTIPFGLAGVVAGLVTRWVGYRVLTKT